MPPAALTSNSPRFLAPFGLLPASPQLQRPIHHAFLLLLDFCLLPRSFNVQFTTLSCSFWTSACFPQLQRPIHHAFLLLLDFYHASHSFNVQSTTFLAPFGLPHASRSFNVQSTTVSCSFWTSACFPAALTSNPPRFLVPFGLLPCFPQLQRPIHHAFLLILDFCLLPRHLKVQSTTHPSHACLPTSSPQRKKATPAHQCQHCFISFNSL